MKLKKLGETWATDTEIEAEVEKKKDTENGKDKGHEVQEIANIQIKTMIGMKEKMLCIPNSLGSQKLSK